MKNFNCTAIYWQACPWECDSHEIPIKNVPWDGMGWDETAHIYISRERVAML